MAKIEQGSVRDSSLRMLRAAQVSPSHGSVATTGIEINQERGRAQREVEAKLKAAFEQARKEGLAQGQAAAQADFQDRLQAEQQQLEAQIAALRKADEERRQCLHQALIDLATQQQRCVAEAEELAVELAYRAVLRLLGGKRDEREFLAETCRAGIQQVGNAVVRVRIPSQAAAFASGLSASGIEVLIDSQLDPGQCFVETSRGEMDVGLATRLEQLKQAWLNTLAEGPDRAG